MKLLGGPEQLKTATLNDIATHGVVSALLATIAITILLLGPSNYDPDNSLNTAAKFVLVVSEVLALGCGLACGRFFLETVAMVNACVLLLMVGVVAVIYLLYGAVLFWITIATGAIYALHTVVVFNYFSTRLDDVYDAHRARLRQAPELQRASSGGGGGGGGGGQDSGQGD
ncbi:hypothetical protein HXX76_014005 [Chlamydomonas incerta]|uniref:Uncharacterized protein n=1 Tax=Chlamydomonas incerta TaxID=51695 RepID=A0A835VTU3_CHLIN|nr:hypothetical protein HXX76_014005 [Chlamydomonas incerta]|eukprot:KAG2425096.1 hypothetical protein HXX76_014005 [Chlamydomonas incerta]